MPRIRQAKVERWEGEGEGEGHSHEDGERQGRRSQKNGGASLFEKLDKTSTI
jgi:hypothetical protein